MSPYTSDEVVAEWVDKAISAKMGAAVGALSASLSGRPPAEELLFKPLAVKRLCARPLTCRS